MDTAAAQEALGGFQDSDRVIGLPPSFHPSFGDTPVAIPLDVLFDSEIMNLDGWASRPLAITFCPLTVSTVVFDRAVVDGARFDVSGLLLNNDNEEHSGNLVMVNEGTGESLWPQMSRRATCGPSQGTALNMLPAIEMEWGRWKELHPTTEVAIAPGASESSSRMRATEPSPREIVSTAQVDEVPLGRVLGIPSRGRFGGGTGGMALAFEDLDDGSPARAVEVTVGGQALAVFWDLEARAAMAFETSESFSVQDGQIVDGATGSVWTVDGRAVGGPRAGEQLSPVETAYISAGPAWFDFQPESDVWGGS